MNKQSIAYSRCNAYICNQVALTMKSKVKILALWDAAGMSASMLCALHCAALPIVLTVSSFSSLAWLDTPWMELSILGMTLIIASYSLTRAYFKHHHILKAIIIVAIGFGDILISRFLPHGTISHLLTAIGGIIIAYAHWVNWKLTQKCHSCHDH